MTELPLPGIAAWRVERRGGYAHWGAPVVLLAHLDAPVAGGLLTSGNLRLEGWAFRIDADGRVAPPQLELHSRGERLSWPLLAVERPDVLAAHGLAADTPPLGFRLLLDRADLPAELSLVLRLEEGQCILARLLFSPEETTLQAALEEGLAADMDPPPPLPEPLPEPLSAPELVALLVQGRLWDGSEAASAAELRQALLRDLALLRALLAPTDWAGGDGGGRSDDAVSGPGEGPGGGAGDGPGDGLDFHPADDAADRLSAGAAEETGRGPGDPVAAVGAALDPLAGRYGMVLLGWLIDGINRAWLAPRQLEFTQHGPRRTFRFWSAEEKTRAMALSSEVLGLLQAAGIPCFHSFGTLLGLVRQGDLLPHDDDIDAVALLPLIGDDTPEAAVAALERRLQQLGHATAGDYRFHRHVEHRGLWFDLFVATLRGEEVTFWGTKIWSTGLEQVLPLRSAELGGLPCVLPHRPELVLAGLYGGGWRTPRPFHYTAIRRQLGSGSHPAAHLRVLEEQQEQERQAQHPPAD